MLDTKRKCSDGDVIFREGEESLTVFVVETGQVELSKSGADGQTPLVTLSAGDMFGEMGVLERLPRNATAVAKGKVTVAVIPRGEFLSRLEKEPDLARSLILQLVARLRSTDARLAGRPPAASHAIVPMAQDDGAVLSAMDGGDEPPERGRGDATPAPRGLLARLSGRFRSRKEADPRRLRILLADPGHPEAMARVAEALGGIPGAEIRRLTDRVPLGGPGETDFRIAAAAAQVLLRNREGDVLLWGAIRDLDAVLDLRFAAAWKPTHLRMGRILPAARVVVPLEAMPEPAAALIRATALCAVTAEGEWRIPDASALLLADVRAAAAYADGETIPLAAEDVAGMRLAWASAAAVCAGLEGAPGDLWDEAAERHLKAASAMPARGGSYDRGDCLIGAALLDFGRAEQEVKAGETPGWDRVADSLTAALETTTRETRPQDWALLHERLGLVCYRRGLAGGDPALFRDAVTHDQQALLGFSRIDHPRKWAAVVSALAQALQVFADLQDSTELLRRALDLYRAALEVRTEADDPLLWAVSRNNLGSVLFLLAKREQKAEDAQEAVQAFRQALAVYELNGLGAVAAVTEKNLARAEALCRRLRRKAERVVHPQWSSQAKEGP